MDWESSVLPLVDDGGGFAAATPPAAVLRLLRSAKSVSLAGSAPPFSAQNAERVECGA